MSLFITGTDTGVGKTHTLTHLLRLLRAAGSNCAGMKPICCGDRRDAELLLAASCEGLTIDQINPLWLRSPAAPLTAAMIEKTEISEGALVAAFSDLRRQVDQIFVEGVGGWLVPIKTDYFVSDLAAALGLPVLVVAQNKLGCINHTLLTVQSIQNRGLKCAGVVLNEQAVQGDIATATNGEILRKLCPAPLLSGLTEKMDNLPPDWISVLAGEGG